MKLTNKVDEGSEDFGIRKRQKREIRTSLEKKTGESKKPFGVALQRGIVGIWEGAKRKSEASEVLEGLRAKLESM